VLHAALSLLARTDGPVILEDFPDDAPGQGEPESREGMVCPVRLGTRSTMAASGLIDRVREEMTQLAPWYELSCATHNRTTVGLTDHKTPAEAATILGEILDDGQPANIPKARWGEMLRFASEDIRNYYLEAAGMRPGGPASPTELANWFWGETSAGSLILALHPLALDSADPGMASVAATQLVPRAQRHRLAKNELP